MGTFQSHCGEKLAMKRQYSDAQTTQGWHCTAALQVNYNTTLASTDLISGQTQLFSGCFRSQQEMSHWHVCFTDMHAHTKTSTYTYEKTRQKEDKINHPLQWNRGKSLSWFLKKQKGQKLETGNINAAQTHIQNRLCRSSVQNVLKKNCSKDTSWPKKHWNTC